jgi:hypothetical protein
MNESINLYMRVFEKNTNVPLSRVFKSKEKITFAPKPIFGRMGSNFWWLLNSECRFHLNIKY